MSKKRGGGQRRREKETDDEILERELAKLQGKDTPIEPPKPKPGQTKAQAASVILREKAKAAEAMQQAAAQTSASTALPPEQLEELQRLVVAQQEEQRRLMSNVSEYTTERAHLANTDWFQLAPNFWVQYRQFESDEDMPAITKLFAEHLTEPYSMFTYHHFIHGWPDLCILAFAHKGDEPPSDSTSGVMAGCIVSKVARKKMRYLRGYIAMLAVNKEFRGCRLGSKLVCESVDLMKRKGCLEVQLETPTTNAQALRLYTSLGFAKTKYLTHYYMDASDAIRLKLWLEPHTPFTQAADKMALEQPQKAQQGEDQQATTEEKPNGDVA